VDAFPYSDSRCRGVVLRCWFGSLRFSSNQSSNFLRFGKPGKKILLCLSAPIPSSFSSLLPPTVFIQHRSVPMDLFRLVLKYAARCPLIVVPSTFCFLLLGVLLSTGIVALCQDLSRPFCSLRRVTVPPFAPPLQSRPPFLPRFFFHFSVPVEYQSSPP